MEGLWALGVAPSLVAGGCLSLCMLVFHHPQKSQSTASGPAHRVCGAGSERPA